ncbi:MAG: bifunctional metallophosphatase/5'-nucleotidase [Firmicutes bacterium]|nr:bifunctional metallophosphatase/5'-nucleotidase [Bacillota bacterium]
MKHKYLEKILSLVLLAALMVTSVQPAYGTETTGKQVQILFTHDLHSHLDPFDVDGEEAGGFARLKAIIDEKTKGAEEAGIPTFLLDGGDFSMGTLYQTIFETEASELTLLGHMGFDATTFGNHEFDYRSIGVANMFHSAIQNGSADPELALPQFLISNIDWDKNQSEDNGLVKEALEDYGYQEYTIIEKNGIKVGIFGVLGQDAEDCAPESGIDFDPIVDSAKEMTAALKEEGAELIVCLSHSGLWEDEEKSEDEILAKEVPEIDLIISGHTHTKLEEPIVHGNTSIVACGEYGKYLGEADLEQGVDGRWTIVNYQLTPVTDEIREDPFIAEKVNEYKAMINAHYLEQFGYEYDTLLAVNPWEFTPFAEFGTELREDTLGSIIADSYIYAVKQAEGEDYERVAMAIAPNGTIRDTVPTGDVTVWDVFNISSLGIGPDRVVGYPLVSIYLTGAELKTVAEIDVSVSSLMSAAQLYPAGIRWEYNPHRLILNRVTDVKLVGDQGEDSELDDDQLYRVIGGLYSAQMLSSVEGMSYGILNVTPKDKDGNPIEDYEEHIVYDAKGNEVKEWYALASYMESFDKNEEGVSVISDRYAEPEGRKVSIDDDSLSAFFRAPNQIAKAIYGIIAAVVIVLILIVLLIVKLVKRIRKK